MNPLRVDPAVHQEMDRAFAGVEPVPVYIELDPGFDHEAIERELDEQLGLTPKPKRERSWDCLAGEAPAVCSHGGRLEKRSAASVGGADGVSLTHWSCACGHSWIEAAS